LNSFDPRYTVRRLREENLYAQGLSSSQTTQRAVRLLEQMGLSAVFLKRRPPQLSSGKRQRIAFARALDIYVQAQVLDLLGQLQAQSGTSLLFIAHDLDVVQHVSDRVLLFKDGSVLEQGAPQQVCGNSVHPYT